MKVPATKDVVYIFRYLDTINSRLIKENNMIDYDFNTTRHENIKTQGLVSISDMLQLSYDQMIYMF